MKADGAKVNSERQAEVCALARSLGMILNMGFSYGPRHPILMRAVQEQMLYLITFLAKNRELTLYFERHEVRWDGVRLDPASSVLARLARHFEAKGIAGVTFSPSVTESDVCKFFNILLAKGEVFGEKGFQARLDEEGVKSIRERYEKISVSKMEAAAAAGSKTTVLDLGFAFNDIIQDEELVGKTAGDGFGGFVQGVLDSLVAKRVDAVFAAEKIRVEFETRLEEVRAESAQKIRRLENICDVMLHELEQLRLPTILVDARLNVLAVNESGRKLLGDAPVLAEESPLYEFAKGGRERQAIRIGGVERMAHRLLSSGGTDSAGTVVLISIEA